MFFCAIGPKYGYVLGQYRIISYLGAHHISSLIVHVAVRMRTTNALDGVLSLVPEVVKGEECYTEWDQVV